MVDKLMYIPNDDTEITTSVEYSYWLKRLDTQHNEWTNQNSLKVLKVVEPSNKTTLLKNTPIVPFLTGILFSFPEVTLLLHQKQFFLQKRVREKGGRLIKRKGILGAVGVLFGSKVI